MKFRKLLAYALKKIYIPLRFKLAASHTLIALLPICIIYLIASNIFSQSLLEETRERITNVISDVTQEIDKNTDGMKKMLLDVTEDENVREVIENPEWIVQNDINHKINIHSRISDMFRHTVLINENNKHSPAAETAGYLRWFSLQAKA